MRIRILQHSPRTPAGSIETWLNERRLSASFTKYFEGDATPNVDEFDWLIILGGAMNVDQEDKFPWLHEEKALIKQAIDNGKTVLGLCLGAQLMAEALGAKVYEHKNWEAGWFPIQMDGKAVPMFQYHHYTFDIPPGAVRIASSAGCANQGFRYGTKVVGVQFHPEATLRWVQQCVEEPEFPATSSGEKFVQSPREVLGKSECQVPAQAWFFELLDELAAKTQW